MSREHVWIDANGNELELSCTIADPGVTLLMGAIGLDRPPSGLNLSPYLSADGSTLVKRRVPHRPIVLPLFLQDDNVNDLIDQVAVAFQGPGILRVTSPGRVRDLTQVIYETGLEGDDAVDMALQFRWRKRIVSLIALDPWWYGETRFVSLDVGAQVEFDEASVDFDDPDVGFDGPSSTGVTVNGHASVSPVVAIEGPFDSCIVGVAGGQFFELSGPLSLGDTIVVDSRPGSRGPRLNAGPIDWSLLTPSSRLWELPTGSSVLSTITDGADVGSNIEVTFRERWLTP